MAFVRACTFEDWVIKKRKEKPRNPDTLTGSHQLPPPNRFWENHQLCSDSAM
jgi:hypothetical protein